jgi:IMP dehydrogenase
MNLVSSGVQLVRVGIGTGGLCSTRQQTKIGMGHFTTLNQFYNGNVESKHDLAIVSDGGIKTAGDVILDLAAGADLCLIGSLFGQTMESDNEDGRVYGMASERLQQEYYNYVKSIEGKEVELQKTISFDNFMERFIYSMRSSMTYQGARTIQELKDNVEFVIIQ